MEPLGLELIVFCATALAMVVENFVCETTRDIFELVGRNSRLVAS